mmetsp:Transcript_45783/g.73272  ORF Transcript_45783/g.73272 Transcript_45783/m.73272 type:complete len:350 (+) Transcript_45783:91-1140(+)
MSEGRAPITIPWTVLTALLLCTALSLFVYSVVKKYWHEKGAPASVRWSLTLCAIFYLLANVFGFVTYVLLAMYAHTAPQVDPKDHPAVRPVWYLMLACYVVAILLNILVWIERLRHVYDSSSYGYSMRFIRGLRIAYIALIVVLLIVFCLFPFNDNDSPDELLGDIILIFLVLFVLLFVGESLTVSVAFVVKLKKMQGVLAKFASDDEETFVFIQNLTYLQMKLTVLVCVQVISTFIGIMMVVPFDGEESPAGVTIDAFVGFMCIYCTLNTHDFAYHKACCCCIRCCAVCVTLPEKIDKVRSGNVEATAVASQTNTNAATARNSTLDATVDITVDNTVEETVDTQTQTQ